MKTHEEFIQEMTQKHPEIKVLGTYQGYRNKIEWVCSNCGNHQFSLPQNLLKKEATGLCRKCFNLMLASSRQKTHEQFLQELSTSHPDIIVSGVYRGKNHKIEWICRKCGEKQLSLPSNLLKPSKTPFCKKCSTQLKSSRIESKPDGNAYSISELNAKRFYEAVSNREHPPILLDEYKGVREKIRFKCTVCGNIWATRPNDFILSKHPCPKCAARSHTVKNEDFIKRLSVINPYVIPLEEYTRQNQYIKCKCSRCGNEWPVTPSALLRGNGCPSCCHTATSYFEQFLLLSLKKLLEKNMYCLEIRKQSVQSWIYIFQIKKLHSSMVHGFTIKKD